MSLPRFYAPELHSESGEATLDRKETRHAMVRRLNRGDLVELFNGRGLTGSGRIVSLSPKQLVVELTGPPVQVARPVRRKVIALGLVKWERFRLAVEKSVELGITDIWPVQADLSQNIHYNVTTKSIKIATEAMKQSGRSLLPDIKEPMTLGDAVKLTSPDDLKLVCRADGRPLVEALKTHPALGDVVFLIGPEGGLTAAELNLATEAGFQPVSLSDAILRTETAVAAAAAVIGQLTRGNGD